jgi:hypothetical protein
VPAGLRHKWLYYAPITSPEREYQLMAQAIAWAWAQREPELQAAEQRGADEELEACCEVLRENLLRSRLLSDLTIERLRAARRPAPPTLREQALAVLRTAEDDGAALTTGDVALIRQALQEEPQCLNQ